MRDTIFISHANPEDNEFAQWLSLKMMGLGYVVWCDIMNLKGGEDFWEVIEPVLRNDTIKYLYVLSKASNHKSGTLKELALAQKVAKGFKDFIIPLHVDKTLSHDDVNIDLMRLNSIPFVQGWSHGLGQLVDKLDDDKVNKPVSEGPAQVKEWWHSKHPANIGLIQKEEILLTNWFPILKMPDKLNFHMFKKQIRYDRIPFDTLKYPAREYGDYLVTFAWCYDFLEELPKTTTYNPNKTISLLVEDIINERLTDDLIPAWEARRVIIELINRSFDKTMPLLGLRLYSMANGKTAYWLQHGFNKTDRVGRIKLVGTLGERYWHFAVSGSTKLYPQPAISVRSHIVFTSDGQEIIKSSSIQHKARRKQGKGWWNSDWRERLLRLMKLVGGEANKVVLPLGSEESCEIATEPISCLSYLSYSEPRKEDRNIISSDEESEDLNEGTEEAEVGDQD